MADSNTGQTGAEGDAPADAKPSFLSRLTEGFKKSEGDKGGVRTRRLFVGFAISGFLTTNFLMFLRFFFPRTIFEPNTVFRIGTPNDFGFGVDTKFQKSQRIWVVKNTERIFVITGLFCSDSRATLSGRSSQSTTPRTNRRYNGSKSGQSFWINTRRTCRSRETFGSEANNSSNGVCCGR